MPTMSEGATRRPSKRSRTGGDDGYETAPAAAVEPTEQPSLILGTRLEPLKDILVSQPAELNGTIIASHSSLQLLRLCVLRIYTRALRHITVSTRPARAHADVTGILDSSPVGVALVLPSNHCRPPCRGL